ncbi:MAG: hypothetical protein FWB96_01370 [Defluviitaleaceae bacterium]|nr:hypothetical protein [Defluviitaleaceae bacterium]MCL2261657.1 hypothetical protein [Defluviitaleaceae bacterium]
MSDYCKTCGGLVETTPHAISSYIVTPLGALPVTLYVIFMVIVIVLAGLMLVHQIKTMKKKRGDTNA